MQWVLASGSPRRKELLGTLVKEFEIIPSLADENVRADSPRQLVALLAERKAKEVAYRAENEGKIVIGSDTVVAFENQVLGKPKDKEDAVRMLQMLSGNTHAVYTGVCFVLKRGGQVRVETQTAKTEVRFLQLSEEWILEYVRGGSPMDKAGAYGIQDGGLVKNIVGSYTNVVGFPTELVTEMIEKVKREWI